MHAMLGVLAKWNQFRYLKLEPSLVKFFDGEKMSKLITTLQERKKVIYFDFYERSLKLRFIAVFKSKLRKDL